MIFACTKKQPININDLILSGDNKTHNSKENNKPYSGPVFYTDENQRVFLEGSLKDGIKDDIWTYWNNDGTKISGYVDFPPNGYTGKVISFQKDKKTISEISTFKEGIKQGPSVYYYSNGNREERTYKDGIKQGSSVWYGSDGDRAEFTYKDGVKQGPSVWYGSDGSREEFTFKEGLKQGPSVYYFSNRDREERTFKDGVRQGPFIFYSSSRGKFRGDKEGGIYIDGKKEGESIYYYSDGTTKSFFYKNNQRLE